MSKPHQRHRLQAVVFDWAGTTVDFGSRAPAQVFCAVFRRQNVEITMAEARAPMGRAKRGHIEEILRMPRVAAAWREAHGAAATVDDVDRVYADFLPRQKETLRRMTDVIPGVPETVAELRRRGLKIGSSTGYTRELMDVVSPLARDGGYQPDDVVCADDVPQGRPAPWMLFRSAERLNVYPMRTIVAVDDTPVGIEAGRHAGAWTVAVTRTGNALGLSSEELAAVPANELQQRLESARQLFLNTGAHYVLEQAADLPPVVETIDGRLERGEAP